MSAARRHRILHVIDSLDLGGAQEALLHLASCADTSRFELEVASMHRHGVYSERFRALGVPVHALSPHRLLPWYVIRLARLVRRGRFDIVHCHLLASNVIAKPIAAALGVPIRFSHDQANDAARHRHPLLLRLDTWANGLSTHICAVSTSTRAFLLDREHLPADRVSLVPNGIRTRPAPPTAAERDQARARWGFEPGAPVIGGIGRLNPQKGFDRFLDAAALALRQRSDLQFVIAGSGPEEGRLKAQAERLMGPGAAGRVRFAGYLQDIGQFLPALDLLLMPSRFEGLPLALLEAMDAGIPAIGSRVDGIAEVIDHETDGLLVDPDNPGAFAAALLDLAADPDRRAAMGARARAKVGARFSAEGMTRTVESLYLRYLGTGNPAQAA